MTFDRITIADVVKNSETTLQVTPSFVRKVMNRQIAGERQTLDCCLEVASNFTAVTGREMLFIIHAAFPRNSEDYKNVNRLMFLEMIAVPSIGDKHSVQDPPLCRSIYKQELKPESDPSEVLYLPIVHLHTHPNQSATPSFLNGAGVVDGADLGNVQSRYKERMTFGNNTFAVTNPTINVINASGGSTFGSQLENDSQFFYQLTGDIDALNRFMHTCYETRERAHDEAHGNIHREAVLFAKAMRVSGAFRAAYFPNGSLFRVQGTPETGYRTIAPQHLKRLGEMFHYTLAVKTLPHWA